MLAANIARLDGRFRILVPLCGKAEDLAFLAANGHSVVGVELVEEAAVEFFAEHAINPEVTRLGDHAIYKAGELTIVVGDWFSTTPELVGHVDGFYDRAALIALGPDVRPKYIEQLRALVGSEAWGIVIGLEYPAAQYQPPPHSVPDREVRGYYRAIELLAEAPATGRVGDANIGAIERCYAVQL